MNKKTFTIALIFFCVSLGWLGINVAWVVRGFCHTEGLLIPVLLFIAGVLMMYNEFHKKKRKRLTDVKKNKIP